MRLTHLFAIMIGVALLTSCSSVRHTSDVAPVANSVASFTVADLNVKPQKVSLTTSWDYNPFRKISISTIKSNTEAALLKQHNSDVLIEPQYIVEERGFLRGGSVTVIGFPAKYENFHKMTTEEAQILKATAKENKQPRKRWFFFF